MTDAAQLEDRFVRAREDLGIPADFPAEVLEAAARVAARAPLDESARAGRTDFTLIPFVTIDPEGSRDLDQALYIQRHAAGWFVLYAIADVGHFVDRGGPVEREAWRRGQTLYGPDTRTPLYPPCIGADVASLLPDVERPSVTFSFDVGENGNHRLLSVARSVIRSRAALSYEAVSRHLADESREPGTGAFAGHDVAPTLDALRTIGRKRQALEIARGGVSLPIAAQHVRQWAPAISGFELQLKHPNDVEGWNAQISLMTGMAAADMMVERGIGFLRTLDEPRADRVQALRLAAEAVGVPWSPETSYPEFVRRLDPSDPVHAALLLQAGGVMGGARYVPFEGSLPAHARHAAIAAHYAHVTAPLRRLADRYVLDLLVRLACGEMPEGSTLATFESLVDVMASSDQLDRRYESRIVDLTEAAAMSPHVGRIFDATVVRLRADRISVQIAAPPVRTDLDVRQTFQGDPAEALLDNGTALHVGDRTIALGQRLELRLDGADLDAGRLRFSALET